MGQPSTFYIANLESKIDKHCHHKDEKTGILLFDL